ncbi:acid protease [Parathielavia appendiculata]|uniref:Probable aspartic-type endopeptidase OPSB n=1 Tax=Parathielavia appendiculata TaxID=2587402 RepID=A0AAN6TYM5_9PEZI|nr:acid protease [Parathielavia appendiculata]
MKTAVYWAFTATLAPIISGLSIPSKRDGLKVVGLETQRVTAPRDPLERLMLRKRGTIETGLDNLKTLYLINATVGTPAKTLRLHIDTGSSDLWVNTPDSNFCSMNTKPCGDAGTYSANASSTYQYVASNFNISYVDGTGATGDYVSDTVTISSQKLDRLQFGIGYSSSNAQGILGIGYPFNEVQVGRAGLGTYHNLPAQLAADGVIQSNAYSIWLNGLDANTGHILFGGVDSEKYVAPLRSLPVESASGLYAEFMITLTRLQLDNKTLGGDNLAIAVLLDTGTSLTYLPDSIVHEIYSTVGAVFDPDANAAYVPCSMARRDDRTGGGGPRLLHFTFSEPTISVAIDELVLDIVSPSTTTIAHWFSSGNGNDGASSSVCLFGISPARKGGTYVLGDTFLRSAYTVYDLENNIVALAQTRFNATAASSVAEIGKGPAGSNIPGATAVRNPVRATEGWRGLHAAPSGGSSSSKSAAVRALSWGGSSGVMVAVGVAVAVGVIVG